MLESNGLFLLNLQSSVQENKIESLDLGFIGETQIFGTPITFTPVNESSSVTGLIRVC